VQPAPIPIPFPVEGACPGPRCGHTLTVVIGSEQRLSNSKLVMFGVHTVCAPARSALLSVACSKRSRLFVCIASYRVLHAGGATALEGPDGGTQPAATAAGVPALQHRVRSHKLQLRRFLIRDVCRYTSRRRNK
jgi:hypothetical protein